MRLLLLLLIVTARLLLQMKNDLTPGVGCDYNAIRWLDRVSMLNEKLVAIRVDLCTFVCMELLYGF